MNLAIIGCGYVADFYMATMRYYPNFKLAGVCDRDDARLDTFSRHFGVRRYKSLDEVVNDPLVDMILNLTNPRSHFDVTKTCLLAGKHVYSEKPLAMEHGQAAELANVAKNKLIGLATAPCCLLSSACQTMWKAIKGGEIGRVRLVYANFDAGMTHRMGASRWRSVSGALWPAKDEFETGCTYEHAPYVLSWLAAFFGPARRVSAYASLRIRDKGFPLDTIAPDFSVGCIEYDDDIVARVTCSSVAPDDRSIVIIGERGVLRVKNVRNDASFVTITRTPANRVVAGIGNRLQLMTDRIDHLFHLPWSVRLPVVEQKIKPAFRPRFLSSGGNKPVDFMAGPHELAQAIRERRACRLSPEVGVHMTELIEALQYPDQFERKHTICSSFDPIVPLPWTG